MSWRRVYAALQAKVLAHHGGSEADAFAAVIARVGCKSCGRGRDLPCAELQQGRPRAPHAERLRAYLKLQELGGT